MKRLNTVLIAILAVQVLLIGATWSKLRFESKKIESRLLLQMKPGDIVSMEVIGVKRVDGKPSDRVFIERGNDGWVFPEADNFPASDETISKIFWKLSAIKVGQPITTNPANHAALEVGDGTRRRVVTLKTATETKTLIMGEGGGSKSIHVRFAGEDAVYRTGGMNIWTAHSLLSNYVDPKFCQLDIRSLQYASITNKKGTVTLTKNQGQWMLGELPEGETVNQDQVDIYLDTITKLDYFVPVGKPKDEGKPNVLQKTEEPEEEVWFCPNCEE